MKTVGPRVKLMKKRFHIMEQNVSEKGESEKMVPAVSQVQLHAQII